MACPINARWLLAALLCAGGAHAQAAAETAAPPPDIEFAADVHLDSIRFHDRPRVEVGFPDAPGLSTRHDTERAGIPTPVKARRRYRGVTVRTTISATVLPPAIDAAAAQAGAPVSPTNPTEESP